MKRRFDQSDTLKFVFTAPHASPDFGEFADRTALTKEQQIEFSDAGTDASLPRIGTQIIGMFSRALGDLNRLPDTADVFPEHDFESIDGTRRRIWGTVLSREMKEHLLDGHHRNFHQRVRAALKEGGNFVMDWHSMPEEYNLGNVEGFRHMPTVILSNNGDPGSAGTTRKDVRTTCDPAIFQMIADVLPLELKRVGLPHDVELNTLSIHPNEDCGEGVLAHNTRNNPWLDVDHRVDAMQVEYSRVITGMPNGEERLREAFERTLEFVQERYGPGNK